MYAAGRIPGSFFRREGGQRGRDPHLPPDRPPAAPRLIKGLRNEVQVVITVLSLNPDTRYDVLAINAASASTQLSGLPFSGPSAPPRSRCRGRVGALPDPRPGSSRLGLRHGRRRPGHRHR
jgi:polyribonucleotide nucleotidyltransferase